MVHGVCMCVRRACGACGVSVSGGLRVVLVVCLGVGRAGGAFGVFFFFDGTGSMVIYSVCVLVALPVCLCVGRACGACCV